MARKNQLDPEHIPNETFDTIIVGGGIVGAGLFREQSLHGLKTLLLDQADFNSQTSQGSSKMLHGGIRYLENLDFALVFEALKEKNLWLKLTPHISKEIPFYLPVYKESKWPLIFMRIGLFLYDLLSLFKNSPHRVLNKKQIQKELPGLKKEGLLGAGLYHDGIVDDSKLGLECIYDGLNNPTSYALNYQKVIKVENLNNGNHLVSFKNKFTETVITRETKHIIFATGPFTDQVMQELEIPWSPVILPSKGTHLWLQKDSLPLEKGMVLQTKDKRIIFVIPQRNSILVGTTEIPLDPEDNMLDIKPTQEEIDYLIEVVNSYFPDSPIDTTHILSSFAAVRPLVKGSFSSSKTSRNHKIYSPQNGIYVLVGGKYTTFRKMAFDLNKIIFKRLGIKHLKNITLRPLRSTSIIKNPFDADLSKEKIQEIIELEGVKTKEDLISRRLSLPSLRHLNNEELKNYLKDLNLK